MMSKTPLSHPSLTTGSLDLKTLLPAVARLHATLSTAWQRISGLPSLPALTRWWNGSRVFASRYQVWSRDTALLYIDFWMWAGNGAWLCSSVPGKCSNTKLKPTALPMDCRLPLDPLLELLPCQVSYHDLCSGFYCCSATTVCSQPKYIQAATCSCPRTGCAPPVFSAQSCGTETASLTLHGCRQIWWDTLEFLR